jgi:hypothetical protein
MRTAIEVPTSAPNIVINADPTPIRFWPAKDAEIKIVAVLLWRRAATTKPDKNAGNIFPSDRRAKRFKFVP